MNPALREAAAYVTARVGGSRFAKPIARAVLVAAGLLLLAFIGKTAVAGAIGAGGSSAAITSSSPASTPDAPSPPPPTPALPVVASSATTADSPSSPHTRATPDDPVVLNTATIDDLKRLPGIGEKRATVIVAVRARLGGRFRAVEDLLKVKGIGRATLRRLRPLVRLDPPAVTTDAGTAEAPR